MGPNLKIMIVEDEIISALALTQDLRQRGYTVGPPIASGKKAIEKVEAERPDVVIMDIRLQGPVNGLEAAKQINSRFGIPIVFITGHVTEMVVDQLKEIDHIGFFSKPVQINEVIKLLKSFF
jgi:two-component system, response regulator PdtaR